MINKLGLHAFVWRANWTDEAARRAIRLTAELGPRTPSTSSDASRPRPSHGPCLSADNLVGNDRPAPTICVFDTSGKTFYGSVETRPG